MGLQPPPLSSTAWAGTNIALVKYWGKRPGPFNVPAAGSLSLTLSELGTTTSVVFGSEPAAQGDRFVLNERAMDPQSAARATRFLDIVRKAANLDRAAHVNTVNTVPTAAGLASSASGFAALALAASQAAGMHLSSTELSVLARQGSGSAARSIFGGFALMSAGIRDDGGDAYASALAGHEDWDVALCIAITTNASKDIGSTEAMQRTAATSPYYKAWIDSVQTDLDDAQQALASRDIDMLGKVAERSCLRMHACAMAAVPGILYWNPVTLGAIQAVMSLRSRGISAYFTIDAGPHVKVLCAASDAQIVAQTLAEVPGVTRTIIARPGPAAHLIDSATKAPL